LVAREGQGFIYYVSVTGVTGARGRFEDRLERLVARVRRYTSLPIGVGFGVSTPAQAAWIASFADAVVVGSALINLIERQTRNQEKVKQGAAFVAHLKRAMKQAKKISI
jgi:tryptophan synthase alpha chain